MNADTCFDKKYFDKIGPIYDHRDKKNRPMWDEHLARRVNGELHADDRLDDQN